MVSRANINIDGNDFDSVVELHDTIVSGEYPNGSAQPAISDLNFTLVNEAARYVIDKIQNGNLGIFHGIKSNLSVGDGTDSLEVFRGFIDASEEFLITESNECSVLMKPFFGLSQFYKRAEAVSYSSMEADGLFSDSDYFEVPYVFEKEDNVLEIVMLSITTYIMVREIAANIKSVGENAQSVIDIIGDPTDITSPVRSIISASVRAVLAATFAAVMLVAVIDLGVQLVESFISFVRYYRACKLKVLLEKGAERMGFTLSSSISELNNLVIAPSKTDKGVLVRNKLKGKSGVPTSNDPIFTISDAFRFAEKMFRAKISIKGKVLHLEPIANKSFWFNQSNLTLEEVRGASNLSSINVEYNTDDMNARRLLSFGYDALDTWSSINYKGTSYEIDVDLITEDDARLNGLSGLDEVNFELGLGNRKDELNALEISLKEVAQLIDNVAGVFGGKPNLSGKIKDRVGMLKISTRNLALARVLYYNGTSMPQNHRDLFSAKTLYNKYHYVDSFVANNGENQYIVKRSVKVPFNFSKFVEVLGTSYFYTDEGDEAQILSFQWEVYNDFAMIDYRVKHKYAPNLKETFIEIE